MVTNWYCKLCDVRHKRCACLHHKRRARLLCQSGCEPAHCRRCRTRYSQDRRRFPALALDGYDRALMRGAVCAAKAAGMTPPLRCQLLAAAPVGGRWLFRQLPRKSRYLGDFFFVRICFVLAASCLLRFLLRLSLKNCLAGHDILKISMYT